MHEIQFKAALRVYAKYYSEFTSILLLKVTVEKKYEVME